MADYTPTLTLSPEEPKAPAAVLTMSASAAAHAEPSKLDLSQLSEAERKIVLDFSDKIDVTDTNAVLTYGAAAQKNIADFSGTTLDSVRTKDMGEVGDMLSKLVVQLKGFGAEDGKKQGLFKKSRNRIATMKAAYDSCEANVDEIANLLEKHQVVLLKDAAMLDQMYDLNQAYFKELTMYILAGKRRLEQCRAEELPKLQQKAEESKLPEDAQKVQDYANMLNRFEKKMYDLEITRMISIQMAPQIRLLQNNDSMMVEKIQTSIVNTIPLWKSQMVLALGMFHSNQAMEAQREVSNMTNELLKKNAEALKMGTIEIAKESERGIADVETLVATNHTLIDTLEQVRVIQQEGSRKRAEAEIELGRIEGELKAKLLDLRK
ncbi:MAG: toxic anion resistance protein [Oscillospiraceae bacterium]|jgi:uncharacterized protein YaaN involved in tellurite resistance|nr:toxic anion resistance protein [Oscillospiraceae bacterium]